MQKNKLTAALLLTVLTLAATAVLAAEGDAPKTKPATKTLPPASTKTGLTFEKDIKPLFEASCTKCHGAQRPKAGLNLTTRDGTLAGTKDGKVVTAGDGTKSLIVESVAQINPDNAMPPAPRGPRRGGPGGPAQGAPGGEKKTEKPADPAHGTNAPATPPENSNRPPGGPGGPGGRNQGPPPKPLTAEEVGIVRAWIDQGAK